jgi:hypothetical protein
MAGVESADSLLKHSQHPRDVDVVVDGHMQEAGELALAILDHRPNVFHCFAIALAAPFHSQLIAQGDYAGPQRAIRGVIGRGRRI